MGAPMIANLVRAGHEVRAVGRSAGSRARAAATGAAVAGSIADACAQADVAITMLPDSPDVLEAVTGSGGVLSELGEGGILIDHSTITPEAAQSVHRAAEARAIGALDAPVSGGEAGAVEGTLSIMAGGRPDVFEKALPILKSLGTTVELVGPAGAGQVVKAANQLIVAGNLAMLAEATVFLERHGADMPKAFDVLAGGLAGSTVLTRKRTNFLERSYNPGFRIELHHKDLGIIHDAARRAGISLPVTSLVSALLTAVRARGGADFDHSALLEAVLALNTPEPSATAPTSRRDLK